MYVLGTSPTLSSGPLTPHERRSLARASAILLSAALIRSVLEPAPAAPPLAHMDSVADSLLVAGDSAALERDRRTKPLEVGEVVDLNTASEVELDRLPGVGAAKAREIVADRQRNGPFTAVSDLSRVPGFGVKTVSKIEPFLRVSRVARRVRNDGAKGGPGGRRLLGGVEPPDSSAGVRVGVRAIDVNRASLAEIEELPGIGPVLARRIVEFRDAQGGIRSVRQLIEIPGLGEKTLARLSGRIRVNE